MPINKQLLVRQVLAHRQLFADNLVSIQSTISALAEDAIDSLIFSAGIRSEQRTTITATQIADRILPEVEDLLKSGENKPTAVHLDDINLKNLVVNTMMRYIPDTELEISLLHTSDYAIVVTLPSQLQ